ncbi:MAG: ABC transporter substrate-binding protein, partial [Deltaproteobacteria bacterium]|nr:ABC transporter substrate-binding protein [Deltaproteobacteria bacterium]
MARYVAAWLLPALAALASVALAPPGELSAQTASANAQGVRPDAVVFGQSCALSGPAKALGEGMRLGIRAAFEEANRAGGIHGRQLRLETRDDRYEP